MLFDRAFKITHGVIVGFMISSSIQVLEAHKSTSGPGYASSQRHNRTGIWVSALGWFLIAGAGISLFLGFSDLQNLALLAIAGVVFIPIGLLLVTNGRILSKLANIEKNTRTTTEAAPIQHNPDE